MTAITQVESLRQRKKDATRRAIEDAAWELFAEQGYDETSINDIAERADVAPRTYFRYFPSKEAVMYPEFEELFVGMRAIFEERPEDEPLLVSLLASLESFAERMTQDTERNRARLETMKSAHETSMGTYFRDRLAEQVAEMVTQRDRDRPDVKLRAQLASSLIGLVMETAKQHWIETGATEPTPEIGQRCISLMRELVGAPTVDG